MQVRWERLSRDGGVIYECATEHGTLTIRQHPHADAWICELQNGKHIIGELADVRRAVEIVLASQDFASLFHVAIPALTTKAAS